MTSSKLLLVLCFFFASTASAFFGPATTTATSLKIFMAKGGNAEAKKVVEAYRAKARGSAPDKEIEQAFKKLVDLFKGDVSSAARVATLQPDIITYITTKPGPRNPNPNRYFAYLLLFNLYSLRLPSLFEPFGRICATFMVLFILPSFCVHILKIRFLSDENGRVCFHFFILKNFYVYFLHRWSYS